MSRPAENPIYEYGIHDEIEGDFENDIAEIQPDPAVTFRVASTPPNFTGQRFTPPPPPPADVNTRRAYGTIPVRASQQPEPRHQFNSETLSAATP